ncbi:uncharacterized protein LOC143028076 [Oratosquilla oratoria]|uniref:uncharacterized protein LOC143028076 n=1 Tax=Oratosquilla oratoria TaxID=337810 RepID=UPI003F772B68
MEGRSQVGERIKGSRGEIKLEKNILKDEMIIIKHLTSLAAGSPHYQPDSEAQQRELSRRYRTGGSSSFLNDAIDKGRQAPEVDHVEKMSMHDEEVVMEKLSEFLTANMASPQQMVVVFDSSMPVNPCLEVCVRAGINLVLLDWASIAVGRATADVTDLNDATDLMNRTDSTDDDGWNLGVTEQNPIRSPGAGERLAGLQLKKVVFGRIYSHRRRRVFLLLRPASLRQVFRYIRSHSLESPDVEWMVVSGVGAAAGLRPLVREGTQVSSSTSRERLIKVELWPPGRGLLLAPPLGDHSDEWQNFPRQDPLTSTNPLNKSFADSILHHLSEGVQVVLAEREDIASYRLIALRVSPRDVITEVPLGKWWLDSSGVARSFLSSSQLFLNLDLQYSDFSGRVLRVSVVDNWPFFKLEELPGGGVRADSGIDYNILTTLAGARNFSYVIVQPDDGQWGSLRPDGSVSGMVGAVARHETHMAIDEITITNARRSVVDFTQPYFQETTVLVSRYPAELSRALAVFQPFTLQVWLSLVVALVLVGPVLHSAARLSSHLQRAQKPEGSEKEEKEAREEDSHVPLHDYAFTAFRNLMVQGNLRRPTLSPVRMIFGFWYFFCFLIYALYSGTLTAFLVTPAFEEPIDSLADLLEAAKKDSFTMGWLADTSAEYIFTVSIRIF